MRTIYTSEIKEKFREKNWDSFNCIFWGGNSIILSLFIIDFSILVNIWQGLLLFKLLFLAISLSIYSFLKPILKTPNWLILGYIILFSTYFFCVIELIDGYKVTIYWSILILLVGSANFILLWKPNFSFLQIAFTLLIFILLEFENDFELYSAKMALGGYAFFGVLIMTSFIPEIKKRNFLFNLKIITEKESHIKNLKKGLIEKNLELGELIELIKIKNEKEKLLRHDLKNKFNNIIGLTNLIEPEDGVLSEEDEESLNLLRGISTDLLTYADTIFSDSDPEKAGKLGIDIEQVELSKCFNKVKNELKPILSTKGLEISILEERKNSIILANFLILNNILLNILNYLIRWSTTGEKVLITTTSLEKHIRIDLSAPSAQITIDEINLIFKPLENFEFQSSFDTPQGLGLQIAKSMTERMGGYFKYEAGIKEGVTFKLAFPIPSPENNLNNET